jgi:hypothetical protein
MRIAALMLLMTVSCIAHTGGPFCGPAEAIQQSNASSGQSSQIKISIAMGGGPFRPARDTFQVGERVPVVITMTNTGSQPVYVCQSGTLYQDRPHLLKDGEPVSYMSFTQSMVDTAEIDETCADTNVPQQILLRPNEPVVVDWFVLALGAASLDDYAWFEQLRPGKYTLSDRRRITCCDGPLVESNSVNFTVVP